MCIKLTQTGKIIVPGQKAIIRVGTKQYQSTWGFLASSADWYGDAFWLANARIESLDDVWYPRKYKLGTMEIDSFYEVGSEFKFKLPKRVGIVHITGHFLVLTEPASKQVQRIHGRQPCWINLKKLAA